MIAPANTLSFVFLMLASVQLYGGELHVHINGISAPKGKIYFTLCHTKTCFEKPSNDANFYAMVAITARQDSEYLILPNLPSGEYAAFVFHDKNNNGDFDISLLGRPKEAFGYSNKLSVSSDPTFHQAKFYIPKSGVVSQHITLNILKK